jgi:hypothetical protein
MEYRIISNTRIMKRNNRYLSQRPEYLQLRMQAPVENTKKTRMQRTERSGIPATDNDLEYATGYDRNQIKPCSTGARGDR